VAAAGSPRTAPHRPVITVPDRTSQAFPRGVSAVRAEQIGEPTGSLGTPEAETARRLARRPTPPGPVACADHVGPPELGCPRGRCPGAICQPAAASAAEPILLWCDTGE